MQTFSTNEICELCQVSRKQLRYYEETSEPSPEELIIQKERQSAVNYALRQISPKGRMLFYRKYYYLQSTAQIASELGMTERAVEGKLYRLKKQLRKMLGGEVHE